MIFHNAGKYSGNVDDLPKANLSPKAVKFKEPETMKELAIKANGLSLLVLALCLAVGFLVKGVLAVDIIGMVLAIATMVPHELLHAIWFRKDVYMYHNLRQGLMFVTGTEDMSVARFIALSMCPNVVFGVIPFVLFLLLPLQGWTFVAGTMGAFAISMGAGDYMNVYNALMQVPQGARVMMSGMNTYWCRVEDMPSEDEGLHEI